MIDSRLAPCDPWRAAFITVLYNVQSTNFLGDSKSRTYLLSFAAAPRTASSLTFPVATRISPSVTLGPTAE